MNGQKAVFAALGDSKVSKSLTERLSKAPYLVVQASYEFEITQHADVVLPVTVWSEQEGTYNQSGRTHSEAIIKVIDAPETVRENLAVIYELAAQMNISLNNNWKEAILARQSSVSLNERNL